MLDLSILAELIEKTEQEKQRTKSAIASAKKQVEESNAKLEKLNEEAKKTNETLFFLKELKERINGQN